MGADDEGRVPEPEERAGTIGEDSLPSVQANEEREEAATPFQSAQREVLIPAATRILFVAGATLAIASFTPWVTVLGFGISGFAIHYGILTVVAAAVAMASGYQFWRGGLVPSTWNRKVAALVTCLCALSLAAALYVGFVIKDNVADDKGAATDLAGEEFSGLGEFERAMKDALTPGVGVGVWLACAGAILGVIGSMPLLTRAESMRSRRVLVPVLGMVLLTVGIGGGLTAKASANRTREVEAARARVEASESAKAAAETQRQRQLAEEQADIRRYDIKTTACKDGEFGESIAVGTITNNSQKDRSYKIGVEFLAKNDDVVDEDTDYIFDLGPGKRARWSAQTFSDGVDSCGHSTVEVS